MTSHSCHSHSRCRTRKTSDPICRVILFWKDFAEQVARRFAAAISVWTSLGTPADDSRVSVGIYLPAACGSTSFTECFLRPYRAVRTAAHVASDLRVSDGLL